MPPLAALSSPLIHAGSLTGGVAAVAAGMTLAMNGLHAAFQDFLKETCHGNLTAVF